MEDLERQFMSAVAALLQDCFMILKSILRQYLSNTHAKDWGPMLSKFARSSYNENDVAALACHWIESRKVYLDLNDEECRVQYETGRIADEKLSTFMRRSH